MHRFVRNVRVDYMDLDTGDESSVYTYKDRLDGKENDAESVQCALRIFKSHHYENCKILGIYIVRMSDKAGNDEIIKEVDRKLIEGFEQWRKQRQSKLAAQENGPSKT